MLQFKHYLTHGSFCRLKWNLIMLGTILLWTTFITRWAVHTKFSKMQQLISFQIIFQLFKVREILYCSKNKKQTEPTTAGHFINFYFKINKKWQVFSLTSYSRKSNWKCIFKNSLMKTHAKTCTLNKTPMILKIKILGASYLGNTFSNIYTNRRKNPFCNKGGNQKKLKCGVTCKKDVNP